MSSDLIQQISSPISAENPSGSQLDEDPDFDKINTEIQKLESLHLGTDNVNPVDWESVVKIGSSLLIQKSKDIRVANWLCMGLYQRQGYDGLSLGLDISLSIIENFWETLYPPLRRLRGRASPFIWLSSKLTPLIIGKEPPTSESEAVLKSARLIEKLVQVLDEKFGDQSPTRADSPNLLDLRKALQSYAVKFKVAEPAPKTEEKPITEQRQPIAATPTEFTSISNAQQIILKACAYMRENQPDDPIPYRLIRIIKWHPVIKLPPSNNGRTELPGILPQLVQGFQNLVNNGDWDKLLRQSENNFTNSPFWFDLQRFTDKSLSELGGAFQRVQQVIREELAFLVKRLPQILDLQFKNGIAFADAQTKMWIETEVLPSVTVPETEDKKAIGVENKIAISEAEDIEKIITEARKLTANGEFQRAISLLLEKTETAKSYREQFIWKINTAELCLESDHHRVALQLLEAMDADVKHFSLEQWEPDLSVRVIRALLQCKRRLIQDIKQPSAEITEQINDLFSRLCNLDIVSAIALEK